ncbi:(d)CMP kinase [Pyruvatibacter mobilis]|uniref:(d)CMP kinase n=1 Tax=Pyruvatibacter mobilis TaxID=1712261 RepID=UPI00186577BB|nr:(d)CMP kinase [Pyruvatibacter mobilis]GGD21023.1 cytidylate kinase [Pyruvatibacter mobilis]
MVDTIIVAIDGPAAAGKGTIAKDLAQQLNLAYLDTGSLYRAVGHAVLKAGGDPDTDADARRAAETLDIEAIDPVAIRTREVGAAASKVAAKPDVRAALLETQRRFAHHPPEGKAGVVLDGRDIGTVVCPDADVKLFVTASDEARATRRWLELKQADPDLTVGDVLADLKERDRRDSERASAPLTKADDAILLDTTDLSIEAAIHAALDIVGRR